MIIHAYTMNAIFKMWGLDKRVEDGDPMFDSYILNVMIAIREEMDTLKSRLNALEAESRDRHT